MVDEPIMPNLFLQVTFDAPQCEQSMDELACGTLGSMSTNASLEQTFPWMPASAVQFTPRHTHRGNFIDGFYSAAVAVENYPSSANVSIAASLVMTSALLTE